MVLLHFPHHLADISCYSPVGQYLSHVIFVDIDIIMPACTIVFDTFHPLSCDVLSSLICKLNKTICVFDPFPTKLLMSHLSCIINILYIIMNLCFSFCVFHVSGQIPPGQIPPEHIPTIQKYMIDLIFRFHQ